MLIFIFAALSMATYWPRALGLHSIRKRYEHGQAANNDD
jgi:hypothetical protein